MANPCRSARCHNVTDTPVGDDAALERAAIALPRYASRLGSRLGVLDLSGIPPLGSPRQVFDRRALGDQFLPGDGSFAGSAARTSCSTNPQEAPKLTLAPPDLEIDFGDAGRGLHYQTEQRSLRAADGGEPIAARAVPEVHVPTARAVAGRYGARGGRAGSHRLARK